MNELMLRVINWFSTEREEGQTLVEYGLILALISVVAILALQAIGTNVTAVFNSIAGTLSGA